MSTGALLTIVSGTPGAGKTAYGVSLILDFLEREPGRAVFVAGITDLQLAHESVPPVKDWTEVRPHPDDPSINYPEFVAFPDGALIVIDEAQNFFRFRTSGSRVPDHVAAMERHRHRGLDFVLLTQGPGLLDPNIRKLCGRHLHIRDTWQGRLIHEWSECANPDTTSERSRAVTQRYKIPKRVFGLYKSSSMHVKRQRTIPKIVWFFLGALGVALLLAWKLYGIVGGAIDGDQPSVATPSASFNQAFSDLTPTAPKKKSEVLGTRPEDYMPRMPQRPETAPLYDDFRQVKSMPVVSACLSMGDDCRCYTGQGTSAYLTKEQCQAWLSDPPFNPWAEPQQTTPHADPSSITTAPTSPDEMLLRSMNMSSAK